MSGSHLAPMMPMNHSTGVPMYNMTTLNGMIPQSNLGANGIPPALQQHGHEQQQNPQQTGPFGKKDSHVKRPMTAYILWSKPRRKQIAGQYPKIYNSEISKQLGAEWKELSEAEKLPFIDRAKQLRKEHQENYPNYKYRTTQKPKSNVKTHEPIVPQFPPVPYFSQSAPPFHAFEAKNQQSALTFYGINSPFLPCVPAPPVTRAYTCEAAASGSQSAINQVHAVKPLNGQIHHQQPNGMQSGSSSLSPTHSLPSVIPWNLSLSASNSSPPQQQGYSNQLSSTQHYYSNQLPTPPPSVSPDRVPQIPLIKPEIAEYTLHPNVTVPQQTSHHIAIVSQQTSYASVIGQSLSILLNNY